MPGVRKEVKAGKEVRVTDGELTIIDQVWREEGMWICSLRGELLQACLSSGLS